MCCVLSISFGDYSHIGPLKTGGLDASEEALEAGKLKGVKSKSLRMRRRRERSF